MSACATISICIRSFVEPEIPEARTVQLHAEHAAAPVVDEMQRPRTCYKPVRACRLHRYVPGGGAGNPQLSAVEEDVVTRVHFAATVVAGHRRELAALQRGAFQTVIGDAREAVPGQRQLVARNLRQDEPVDSGVGEKLSLIQRKQLEFAVGYLCP